jgi:EAL domain-containing protein (putative c-di-GMP-specific phosphodiesterase class I)
MIVVDKWVLRQALKCCAELHEKRVQVPISINLSVDSLADMYLAERVRDALHEARVDASLLQVEILKGR